MERTTADIIRGSLIGAAVAVFIGIAATTVLVLNGVGSFADHLAAFGFYLWCGVGGGAVAGCFRRRVRSIWTSIGAVTLVAAYINGCAGLAIRGAPWDWSGSQWIWAMASSMIVGTGLGCYAWLHRSTLASLWN